MASARSTSSPAPPSPAPPRVIDAVFVAGASRVEQLPPPQHLEVAFAGRSNVGKSSLMNALVERRKLVRTSSTPGCTRQISLFDVTTRLGSRLTLVDLPGYGYAKRSHAERREWAELIQGYLLGRAALALLVALVDVRRGVEEDDELLREWITDPPRGSAARADASRPSVSRSPVEMLWVATKLDKLPSSQRRLALDQLEAKTKRKWLGFSTELPETHQPLWRAILRRVDLDQAPAAPPPDSAAP